MARRSGTLSTFATAVRERRVRATDVIDAAIDALDRHGQLNVLAEKTYDDALAAAHSLDDDSSLEGPLVGVPVLIKDLEDLKGHPTSKGSLALRDAPTARANAVFHNDSSTPARLLSESQPCRSSPLRVTPRIF